LVIRGLALELGEKESVIEGHGYPTIPVLVMTAKRQTGGDWDSTRGMLRIEQPIPLPRRGYPGMAECLPFLCCPHEPQCYAAHVVRDCERGQLETDHGETALPPIAMPEM
jgi:hypothetical protein